MNLHRMLNQESPTRNQGPPLHTPTPRTTQPSVPLMSIKPKKQPQLLTDFWGFQGCFGVKGSFASQHTRRKKEGCTIGTCFEASFVCLLHPCLLLTRTTSTLTSTYSVLVSFQSAMLTTQETLQDCTGERLQIQQRKPQLTADYRIFPPCPRLRQQYPGHGSLSLRPRSNTGGPSVCSQVPRLPDEGFQIGVSEQPSRTKTIPNCSHCFWRFNHPGGLTWKKSKHLALLKRSLKWARTMFETTRSTVPLP